MRLGLALCLLAALLGAQAAPARALSSAQLLARYEPVSVLHPQEWFPPLSVDGFLGSAALEQLVGGAWMPVTPTPATLPTTDPASWRLHDSRCSAAVGLASIPCFTGIDSGPTAVYGAVFRVGDRIALQYWYWYADGIDPVLLTP